jgi:predicted RND superfamily exporter protein
MTEGLAHFVIRWRYAVIAITLALLGLLASGARQLQFTNDYRVFFGSHNPQLAAFENLQDTYVKNDNVLIMLEPGDGQVFTRNSLTAVVELTERAWQLPYSIRVDSITNFQHSQAQGDELIVQDLVSEPRSLTDTELIGVRAIALAEPALRARLISPRTDVTAVNIVFELPGKDTNAEVPQVVRAVRALLGEMRTRYPDIAFYTTGVVFMNNAFAEASRSDLRTLVPVAFAVIVIGLFAFLRQLTAIFATVAVIAFSILMAMGTTGWLGIMLTPPSAIAPTIILTLAVADSVHFLVTFLHAMREGLSQREAIVESFRVNLHPIFLTSLTTAIGFLSLNFSDSPPFNDLGNITTLGVGYAFALSILFLPALLAVLPVRVRHGPSQASRFMGALAEFVIARRTGLLWALGVPAVALIALIPRNELNDIFVNYFDPSVGFRRDTDHVTERLTGLYFVDFSVPSGQAGGINEPPYLHTLDEFATWLRAQSEVVHVAVITDTFKRLNQNMHGDDKRFYRLPERRDLAAQYLLLYEMSLPYGLDLNDRIDIAKSATRVSVSLKTLSTRQVLAFEERVAQWFDDHAPALKTQGASPTIMFSHIGARNIRSMLIGTTVALALISLVLILALRSLKLGLISLIPNLLPVGMAFGLWALAVGEVGLALSVVASMSLGIVVDDTVHFLSKYLRARREQGIDAPNAVRYAFSTVGVALWVTSAVLIGGFLVLSRSAFELNADMGLLTAITLLMTFEESSP